jgi:hypothetical protein
MNSADRAGIHEAERGGVRLKVDYERSGNADVIVRLSAKSTCPWRDTFSSCSRRRWSGSLRRLSSISEA